MWKPKVKIVAVAKNEGYFLPQWVYHHFYMGFDAIDVYINRSVDTSVEILHSLKLIYPSLSCHSADWVDHVEGSANEVKNLQHLIYSYAYYQTLQGYDYVLFLDIDEFWMPRDRIETIHDCLRTLNYPDMITFEWFCINGSDAYKTPLFERKQFTGHISSLGKSIVRTSLNLPTVHLHIQSFQQPGRAVLADGQITRTMREDKNFIDKKLIGSLKPYFIIHDWMRSPDFYLSNIANGNTNRSQVRSFSLLKSNKLHYNCSYGATTMGISTSLPGSYYSDYQRLLSHANIRENMAKSRQVRLYMALDTIRLCKMHPQEKLSKAVQKSLGDLHSAARRIVTELEDVSYASYLAVENILSPNDCINENIKETHANFTHLIDLYPYAVDQHGHPIFIKEYVRWLAKSGNFDAISDILNNHKNRSLKSYGKEWAILLLARAYEQNGMHEKTIKYYNMLRHSELNEVYDALTRFESNS